MRAKHLSYFTFLASFSVLLSSCGNIFSFDHASGDPQLLSAARACLDKGDLNCAADNYQKLSSTDSDQATSELAFTTLDSQGASMANLIQFVGDIANTSNAGLAVTNFAQRMNSGAGEAKRVAIWNAFYSYTQVKDPSLKQFVRFVGALSLAGELLAEAQGTDSTLKQSDLVANPSACITASQASPAGCGTATACAGGSSPLTTTVGSPPPAIDDSGTTLGSSPTLTAANTDYLYGALQSASSALSTLGATGKFGKAFGLFQTILGSTGAKPSSAAQADQCFRYELISNGVSSSS